MEEEKNFSSSTCQQFVCNLYYTIVYDGAILAPLKELNNKIVFQLKVKSDIKT